MYKLSMKLDNFSFKAFKSRWFQYLPFESHFYTCELSPGGKSTSSTVLWTSAQTVTRSKPWKKMPDAAPLINSDFCPEPSESTENK